MSYHPMKRKSSIVRPALHRHLLAACLGLSLTALCSAQSVTGFTLVNADTDTDIKPLADGAVIDLRLLPMHLALRANTSPTIVGSVRFGLDAVASFRTENAFPYALFSDSGGNYKPWTLSVGAHRVTATAYSGSSAGGTAGTPLSIGFTLTDGAPATTGRFMYAVYNSGGNIGVYDIDNGHRLVKTIPTVSGVIDVEGACASAVTGRLYFSHNANQFGAGTSGSIVCVDLRTEKVLWHRTYLPNVDRLSITPDGRKLYVPTNENATGSDFDFVLDGATGDVIGRVPLTPKTHDAVIGISGRYVYQETKSSRYVAMIDTTTDKVVRNIGPFNGINGPLTINGSDSRLLVNTFGLHGFQVADVRTGAVIANAQIVGDPLPGGGGLYNHGVAWRPDEKEAWVIEGGKVIVFDMTSLPPRQTHVLPLSGSGHWVTFSIDGRYAYPSGTGYGSDVFDTRTYSRVGTIGKSEYALEVDWKDGVIVAVGDQYGIGRVPAPAP